MPEVLAYVTSRRKQMGWGGGRPLWSWPNLAWGGSLPAGGGLVTRPWKSGAKSICCFFSLFAALQPRLGLLWCSRGGHSLHLLLILMIIQRVKCSTSSTKQAPQKNRRLGNVLHFRGKSSCRGTWRMHVVSNFVSPWGHVGADHNPRFVTSATYLDLYQGPTSGHAIWRGFEIRNGGTKILLGENQSYRWIFSISYFDSLYYDSRDE